MASDAVSRICGSESGLKNWAIQAGEEPEAVSEPRREPGGGFRQEKTTTLTQTIRTIQFLSRSCLKEAEELRRLQDSVNDIKERARLALGQESVVNQKDVNLDGELGSSDKTRT